METSPTTFSDAEEEQRLEIRQRLAAVCDAAKERRLRDWFVPRHATDGRSLETIFDEWLSHETQFMLRILGETGAGKTTLKDHLFLQLAERVLRCASGRIPVEMDFAEAVNAVTRAASGQSGAMDIGPKNEVIFLDGHEGRLAALEDYASVTSGTKVVVLQREAIIRPTPSVIPLRRRSPDVNGCTTIRLRTLSLDETRNAVKLFFPIALEESGATSRTRVWQEERLSALLSGAFDALLVSPAMAHRLSRIAAEPGIEMISNQENSGWVFRTPTASPP